MFGGLLLFAYDGVDTVNNLIGARKLSIYCDSLVKNNMIHKSIIFLFFRETQKCLYIVSLNVWLNLEVVTNSCLKCPLGFLVQIMK